MREFKFRAWLKKEKLMGRVTLLEWLDFDPDMDLAFETIKVQVGMSTYTAFPDEIELMQYTGLHDKNGVEIYEGDIVKGSGRLAVCTFRINKALGVEVGSGFKFLAIQSDSLEHFLLKEKEVIGNIYENKDLIEETR